MGSEQLLILSNFLTCTMGGWICICRMKLMSHSETKMEVRAQYMIWFVIFASSGWSFVFGANPNVIQFMMSLGVLAHLLIGSSVWKQRAPDYTRRADDPSAST